MAQLSDYRISDFRQGPELRRAYQFNKKMWGGICFALLCEWVKVLMKDPDCDRMQELGDNFKLAGGRQMIYTSGLKAKKITTWQKYAQVLTELGRHFGIEFEYLGSGNSAQILRNTLKNASFQNKLLYLSIKFAQGGGHAIGMIALAEGAVLFDPNYGEHEVEQAKVGSLCRALFRAYSGLNGGISDFHLYEMSKQQTVMEFWKRLEASQ